MPIRSAYEVAQYFRLWYNEDAMVREIFTEWIALTLTQNQLMGAWLGDFDCTFSRKADKKVSKKTSYVPVLNEVYKWLSVSVWAVVFPHPGCAGQVAPRWWDIKPARAGDMFENLFWHAMDGRRHDASGKL